MTPMRTSDSPIPFPIRLVVLVLACLLVAAAAPAADVSWLTAVSGTWDDGTKWSGGVPPDDGDSALITVAPGLGGYQILVDADADVGRLVLGSGGAGPNFQVDAATFRILGPSTSVVESGGSLSLSNLAIFRFQAATEFRSGITFGGGVGGGGSWFNDASISFDGGAAAVYNLDEIFDNAGTLSVDSGRLLVSDPLTNSGDLEVAPGAEIEFDVGGTTHTLAEGTTFSGGGTVTVFGTVLLDVTATTPPTFGAGLTVVVGGGLKGGSVVVDGTLELLGSLLGTGELRNRGLVVADGTLDTKTLANEATLEVDGLNLFGGAVVDNEAAGLVTLADTGISGSGSVSNAGTLRKASGGGTGFVSPPLTSTGTVEALSGTLDLSDFTQTAGTTTVNATLSSSSTLDVQGGVLEGTGTVAAVVDLGGTVHAGDGGIGTLAFQSNLNFGAGARLFAEIGGTAAGSGYDQVTVAGTASLDGTLELVLVNAFEPSLGNSFVVLSGSTTGSFASLDLPPLTPGLTWQVTTDPVTATVVDDPSLIFADGFESGDVDAWTTSVGLLDGLLAAPGADRLLVRWQPAHGKSLRLQSTILSARDADNSEIYAIESRRRGSAVEVKLRSGNDSTQWIEVSRHAEITIRYRPALDSLGDGAVFLDVDGRLEGWLTELPVTRGLDRVRYHDGELSLETP